MEEWKKGGVGGRDVLLQWWKAKVDIFNFGASCSFICNILL